MWRMDLLIRHKCGEWKILLDITDVDPLDVDLNKLKQKEG